MTDAITEHETALLHAFAKVVRAEQDQTAAATELQAAEARLKPRLAAAGTALAEAWAGVRQLMAEAGETEVTIPYAPGLLARVHYTTPGVSAVVDAEACPDDLVQVTRKPKLAEVKRRHLDDWRDGRNLPNWLRFEKGEPQLTWTPTKDGGKP